MPTYEYHCRDCDERFEIVETIRRHERRRHTACPKCSGRDTERVWSRVGVGGAGSKGYHPAKPLDV